MRYYNHTPIRMAKVKIIIILVVGKDAEKLYQLYIVGGNVKWDIHTGKIDQLLLGRPSTLLELSNCTFGHLL